MPKTPLYNTVGEVRTDVDAAFAQHNLKTAGGSLYRHTQSLIFGLVDAQGVRVGDAYCLLPVRGWAAYSYQPETDPNDHLRLRVINGAGRLVLLTEGGVREIDTTTDITLPMVSGTRDFQLANPYNELLVVHALSTFDPTNPTDIRRSGDHEISDTWLL